MLVPYLDNGGGQCATHHAIQNWASQGCSRTKLQGECRRGLRRIVQRNSPITPRRLHHSCHSQLWAYTTALLPGNGWRKCTGMVQQ